MVDSRREAEASIVNSAIKRCSAEENGGGLYVERSHVSIAGTAIAHCAAARMGGAMTVYSGSAEFLSGTGTDNIAAWSGGFVHARYSNLTLASTPSASYKGWFSGSATEKHSISESSADADVSALFPPNCAIAHVALRLRYCRWLHQR